MEWNIHYLLIKIPQNFVLLWWIFKNRWHLLIPIFISLLNDLMKQSTQLFGVPLRTTSWVSEFLFVWIERTSGLMFFRLSAFCESCHKYSAISCLFSMMLYILYWSFQVMIEFTLIHITLHCCFNTHHLNIDYTNFVSNAHTRAPHISYMCLSRPWWYNTVQLA